MQAKFKNLLVWQRAKKLAVMVYRITGKGPSSLDWGFRDQMRKAAVSIASNMGEGNERGSDKDACRLLFVAKGSAGELLTQAEIGAEVHLLERDDAADIVRECDEIGRMLSGLIAFRGGESGSLAPRPLPLAPN